jgi:hypothetical protein
MQQQKNFAGFSALGAALSSRLAASGDGASRIAGAARIATAGGASGIAAPAPNIAFPGIAALVEAAPVVALTVPSNGTSSGSNTAPSAEQHIVKSDRDKAVPSFT